MIQPVKISRSTEQAIVRTKVCGGLGNQLFQYAAARALSLKNDCQLELDLSFYDARRHRAFELDRFPIEARWKLPSRNRLSARRLVDTFQKARKRRPEYREISKRFDADFHGLSAPIDLDGYFFSDKYFSDHSDIIRVELKPPAAEDHHSADLRTRIASEESTALHIRRGDYVTNKKASERFWSCSLEYYERAMQQIGGNGPAFVFSDDIQWARENLKPVMPLHFIDADPNQDGIRDMWLMTHAHHHIIANSSFSWWGAWLAGEPGGQAKGATIAPAKWFNDPTIDDTDMVPEAWIRL